MALYQARSSHTPVIKGLSGWCPGRDSGPVWVAVIRRYAFHLPAHVPSFQNHPSNLLLVTNTVLRIFRPSAFRVSTAGFMAWYEILPRRKLDGFELVYQLVSRLLPPEIELAEDVHLSNATKRMSRYTKNPASRAIPKPSAKSAMSLRMRSQLIICVSGT